MANLMNFFFILTLLDANQSLMVRYQMMNIIIVTPRSDDEYYHCNSNVVQHECKLQFKVFNETGWFVLYM
jgi:hypothetical protein